MTRQQWARRGEWPCNWIALPDSGPAPYVAAYRKRFELAEGAEIRIHVTADERYELFLDGKRIGRGSERGDQRNWFYETYLLTLPAGSHTLVARVWTLGGQAPSAQMTVCHGFLCCPEGEFVQLIGTGVAEWEAKRLDGYTFLSSKMAWGTGARVDIDGAKYPWGVEAGQGEGWGQVKKLHPGANGWVKNAFAVMHLLKPATLPPMLQQPVPAAKVRHIEASADSEATVHAANHIAAETPGWQALLSGGSLVIPPHSTRRVILDFDNYYCAYPLLAASGGKGSSISIDWAEGLFTGSGPISGGGEANAPRKDNRDVIEGKRFVGVGCVFRPDGGSGRVFETLWWESGRYLQIIVCTGDEPLRLDRLSFTETRYPLSPESAMSCNDRRWEEVQRLSTRVVQMCSHETYFDCPYYEQLMYVGDTRIQALITYAITHDSRLPRKAVQMFDASRLVDRGLTNCCYPCGSVQIIPPFSLWYTLMVYDFAMWRGDRDFIRRLMPGVRTILETFMQYRDEAGLVKAPVGWNFMDWVPEWSATTNDSRNWGVPPDGEFGVNGSIQWLTILSLQRIAEIEEWLGETELASRDRRLASDITRATEQAFWDAGRGLYAEDVSHEHYSEHSQCLAILSGVLDAKRQRALGETLIKATGLVRTTIYFTHYLFETFCQVGRVDQLFKRLDLWYELEKNGLKTTIEEPEPSRSDCHGWGAHPLYHFYTTILGIRPSAFGFAAVDIHPQLGTLTEARGRMAHPAGMINVDYSVRDGKLSGTIELPPGLAGQFRYGTRTIELRSGSQTISAAL